MLSTYVSMDPYTLLLKLEGRFLLGAAGRLSSMFGFHIPVDHEYAHLPVIFLCFCEVAEIRPHSFVFAWWLFPSRSIFFDLVRSEVLNSYASECCLVFIRVDCGIQNSVGETGRIFMQRVLGVHWMSMCSLLAAQLFTNWVITHFCERTRSLLKIPDS
jgi:hypothetical protein